jgi:hypothetical protein
MAALLVVGALALAIIGGLGSKALPSRAARIGYAVAVTAWLGAGLVFILADHFFLKAAHPTAAVLMFLCIFGVVCINVREYKDNGPATSRWNRYAVIAVAMGTSFVVFPVAGAFGWQYWILGIEIALISLFAAFWLIQTDDLSDEGLR